MRRREFIRFLGASAMMWPLAARAQQREKVRRIGVLVNGRKTDAFMVARVEAFTNTLPSLGWNAGNARIDIRFGVGNDELREKANELIEFASDVVLAITPPSVFAVRRVSRTVPIVFVAVTDPVGLGIVQDLAHPGGNATGFLSAEFGFGAKWLELLKEVVPSLRKVVVITDPDNVSAAAQFAAIQAVAPTIGIELRLLRANDNSSLERGIADCARSGNCGLIALRIAEVITHRKAIIRLAAQYRVPAIYPLSAFAADGGLISYGPDTVDQCRRAAVYVDRILKGEKPADLPVQAPNKYEMVINLKTAKALGLTIPPTMLARADKVIE
jgi:putative ABC transport system substrate-binding protein